MIDPDKLCQKRDCAHEATHLLKLCVPYDGHGGVDGPTALLGVRVCASHLEEEHDGGRWLEDNSALRSVLVLAAQGHPLDFSAAWISGVPLNSPEGQSLSLHAPRPN